VDVIDAAGPRSLIDEAAQIWAEATAARDGHDQVPPLHVLRPVTMSVLICDQALTPGQDLNAYP
jgi:hypothetical protein